MNNEMINDEVVDTIPAQEEQIVEEPEPEKIYDLIAIEAAYNKIRDGIMDGSINTQTMSKIEYGKYNWLEERLCDAGIIGPLAWEKEFEVEDE